MKRHIFSTLLALPLCATLQTAAFAQPAVEAPRPDNLPRAANGAPRELPTNQESGVEIDRFIGYPGTAFSKVWNGFFTRSMLRAGDPYSPGPTGAVLEYRDDLSVATIEARHTSGTASLPAVTYYYVQAGVGKIDTGPGTTAYDLRPGVGVLIAPNVKQHIVNTGDEQLSMIMLTWTNNEGLKVKQDIKVVDSNTVPMNTNRAHWIHAGQPMFNTNDGVNITISPINFPTMAYAGPHAHVKGVEEIWVKVGGGTGYAILGSEIREVVGTGAFLSPPNGITTHSSMNLDKERPQVWLYISRRMPPAAPAAPPPR